MLSPLSDTFNCILPEAGAGGGRGVVVGRTTSHILHPQGFSHSCLCLHGEEGPEPQSQEHRSLLRKDTAPAPGLSGVCDHSSGSLRMVTGTVEDALCRPGDMSALRSFGQVCHCMQPGVCTGAGWFCLLLLIQEI